jgi:hypothetical protein
VDRTPPHLAAAEPESGSAGHGALDRVRFAFSEKMEREDAFRWLAVFPDRKIRDTDWDGARVATVEFETPLPADTVVVVEIQPGMSDAHGVPQPRGRIFAFATGDSLYAGSLGGGVVLQEEPLPAAVVELLPTGPDSVRLVQRPVLRRAVADSAGLWKLRWLPADGEPWLLRIYDDRNGDRRAGENEASRIFPDTLRLTAAEPSRDIGLRTIYRPDTPGSLEGELDGRPDVPGPVFAFTLEIAAEDTGYVPAPDAAGAPPAVAVPDTGRFTLPEAGPGMVRAVFFVDQDGDSLFSAVGDTADTMWALEPWALVDSLTVEPGLPADLPAPVWPDTLTLWPAPERPDTTAALPPDSLAITPPDTAAGAAPDTTAAGAPADTTAAAPADTTADEGR